jgi:hypothetical protein
VGGPGNSLDRNYHYSINKDLKFFANRMNNTDVGFVNLFIRYDKPWMNKRTRSMNVWLDWALRGHDMSHTGVINTASIIREVCTSHGLCLNSQGERRLANLAAEKMGGNHVTDVRSIPVITNAEPLLF